MSSFTACGGDSSSSGDDAPPTDAGADPDSGDLQPPARGFQIQTPDIDILPGQEITKCYYFRTPNTEAMAIKRWVSEMTPGSHHMIMFTTTDIQGQPVDKMPPGTVSEANCGFGGGSTIPNWIYAAQTPSSELELPTDDGAGKPLAIDIPANSAGFFQMHYLNSTDETVKARVTLNAEALEAGAAYTKTAAYITYNNSISIPPMAVGDVESQTCAVPAGLKFWLMSTHAHKQAVKTLVKNGGPTSTDMAFTSTEWEHPGTQQWMTAPFYTFADNQLTYECTYDNLGDNKARTISSGDSAKTDEMCMATGYFFPATRARICFNGTLF